MTIKDSGERTSFETGAQRDCQGGKGRMDLLPMRALMEVSKIFEAGANKYSERNWEKGMPLSRYADSMQRHFAKWMIGRDDERHLEMACWNLLCLVDTNERIKDGSLLLHLNDLPCNPDFMPAPDPGVQVNKEVSDRYNKMALQALEAECTKFEMRSGKDIGTETKETLHKLAKGEYNGS